MTMADEFRFLAGCGCSFRLTVPQPRVRGFRGFRGAMGVGIMILASGFRVHVEWKMQQ